MKSIVTSIIVLFSVLLSVLFSTVQSIAQTPAGFSSSFRHLCGQSDKVWDYIYETMGDNHYVANVGMGSKQGESGRQFLIFSDQSWLVTLEYFDHVTADRDVSCIVAHGQGHDSAMDAINIRIQQLPAEALGTIRELTAIEKLLSEPAYRLDI